MKNNNSLRYWAKREREHIKKQIKNDKLIANRIKNNQLKTMREIQKEINAFYGRYASAEGISIVEARKRIAKHDVRAFQSKAKEYVKLKIFSPRANEELRLYNVTMRTNRLEALKANINLELVGMANAEERVLLNSLHEQARQEYIRQSGILGMSINYNERNIRKIVNSSFNNAEWSYRLWDNQDALRTELNRLLSRSVVQGRNPRVLARELRKKFDTSIHNSERLMRTEGARVQQDVFTDSAKQTNVDEYVFIAEPDACPICAELNDEVFKFSEMSIGENAYPIHPNCRCSSALYIERSD